MKKIDQPTTIRMLYKNMNATGFTIDLVSLRRCITNLSKPNPKGKWLNHWGKKVIQVVHERPCPITEVTVGWYNIIPEVLQTKLF